MSMDDWNNIGVRLKIEKISRYHSSQQPFGNMNAGWYNFVIEVS